MKNERTTFDYKNRLKAAKAIQKQFAKFYDADEITAFKSFVNEQATIAKNLFAFNQATTEKEKQIVDWIGANIDLWQLETEANKHFNTFIDGNYAPDGAKQAEFINLICKIIK